MLLASEEIKKQYCIIKYGLAQMELHHFSIGPHFPVGPHPGVRHYLIYLCFSGGFLFLFLFFVSGFCNKSERHCKLPHYFTGIDPDISMGMTLPFLLYHH